MTNSNFVVTFAFEFEFDFAAVVAVLLVGKRVSFLWKNASTTKDSVVVVDEDIANRNRADPSK